MRMRSSFKQNCYRGSGRSYNPNSHIFIEQLGRPKVFALSEFGYYSGHTDRNSEFKASRHPDILYIHNSISISIRFR